MDDQLKEYFIGPFIYFSLDAIMYNYFNEKDELTLGLHGWIIELDQEKTPTLVRKKARAENFNNTI